MKGKRRAQNRKSSKKAEDLNITLNTIYGINIDNDSIKDKLKEYNLYLYKNLEKKTIKNNIVGEKESEINFIPESYIEMNHKNL
ncbi:hypothetical protein JTT01_01065 [Clostridium botulinum]|nr:hypothetical protein [Clostridium botulinum]